MSYYAAARAKYPRDAYQAGDKVQLADGFTYVVDAVDNGDSDSSDHNEGAAKNRKKRKLNYHKCHFCRRDKKKCEPPDRQWPGQRCLRCISLRLECSEPTTSQAKKVARPSKSHRLAGPIAIESASPRRSIESQDHVLERAESRSRHDGEFSIPPYTEGSLVLIDLLPAMDSSDELACSYYVLSMEDNPQYEAISYTWFDRNGPPKETIAAHSMLIIEDGMIRTRVGLTENLWAALRSIRHARHSEPRQLIWVDALCIDSIPLAFKTSSIALIPKIFQMANHVYVWLGPDDDSSVSAVSSLHCLLENEGLVGRPSHTEMQANRVDWKAIHTLVRRVWFHRAWVVQEIALARSADLRCGSDHIAWDEFADAITCIGELSSARVDWYVHADMGPRHVRSPDFLASLRGIKDSNAYRLVKMLPKMFRFHNGTQNRECLLNLEDLVCEFATFTVSNQLDRIYAYISLARDALKEPFKGYVSSWEQPFCVSDRLKRRGLSAEREQYLRQSLLTHEVWRMFKCRQADKHNLPSNMPDRRFSPKRTVNVPRPSNLSARQAEIALEVIRKLKAGVAVSRSEGRGLAISRRLSRQHNHISRIVRTLFFTRDHITIDYTQSFTDLAIDFVRSSISASNSLDIIMRPWAPNDLDNHGDLPSWILSLPRKHTDSLPVTMHLPAQADLAETLANSEHARNASGHKPPHWRITGRELKIRGIAFDEIQECFDPCILGIIPWEWLELAEDIKRADGGTLWRLMVGGRDEFGKRAPQWFARAFHQLRMITSVGEDCDIRRLLEMDNNSEMMARYMACVVKTCTDKRLVALKRVGRFALVPRRARRGDQVHIIYGCSVPVVLRQHLDSTQWKVVGDCYVDNIMDGQALRDNSLAEETITLI